MEVDDASGTGGKTFGTASSRAACTKNEAISAFSNVRSERKRIGNNGRGEWNASGTKPEILRYKQ